MRVSIYVDGEGTSVKGGDGLGAVGEAPFGQALAGDGPTDAGAGPDGGGMSGAAAADDTGGPPNWLLQAVGKAEAEAAGGELDQAGAGVDAGAGPSA